MKSSAFDRDICVGAIYVKFESCLLVLCTYGVFMQYGVESTMALRC